MDRQQPSASLSYNYADFLLESTFLKRTAFHTPLKFFVAIVGGRQCALKTSQHVVIMNTCKRGPYDSVMTRKESHVGKDWLRSNREAALRKQLPTSPLEVQPFSKHWKDRQDFQSC